MKKQYEEFTGALFAEETNVPAQPTAFEQKFFDRADAREARASKTSAEAEAKTEAGWKMLEVIPMGQPVHGSADRRYRDKASAKIDGGYAMMKKAEYQERKAEASREYAEKVQSGAIARSDDPEAIQKLENRIAELTEQHELSKQAVKKHNAEFDRAVKAGEFEIRVLDPWGQPLKDDASDYAKKHAYKAYYKDGKRVYKATVEQSTTAEIRRLKKRIEEIRKTSEICKASDGWTFDGGHIELNTEAGRIQAYFDEIPDNDTRMTLKRDGWHWSKNAGAWQKMLNEWNIRRAKALDIFKPAEEAEQPEATPAEAPQMPTEALEEVQTENNTLEMKKPSEKRTAPKTKEVKKLTPEELAQKLEELKQSDDWRLSAVLMMRGNRNHDIIMIAGISAGVVTFEEFDEYMTAGRMPHYHTYAEWKKLGRQVKRGEKARFTARIWEYTEKKGEMTAEQAEALNTMMRNADGREYKEGDETLSSSFIKKEAFFFGLDQTEKAGEIKHFEIGRQYTTSIGVITVTDRTETTLTFTAKGKTFTKDIQANKKTELVKLNKAGLTAQAIQEVPEAQKPIEKEVKQESAEPETVKFIPNMVYWGRYQIIKRTDKSLKIRDILSNSEYWKKIQIREKRTAISADKNFEYVAEPEHEFINVGEKWLKLRATATPEPIEMAVENKINSLKEYINAERENPFSRTCISDYETELAMYQRLADELKQQAA